ncbi:MAG: sulfatase-like hydrolase/transferase [Armatimonadota bacterium]
MSDERRALLIVIDAARREETHAALAASRMPALAGAATGTLIAPSCWTLPSMTSVLTGRFPAEHSMTWPADDRRCTLPTIADMLRDAGRSFRLLSGNHMYAPPVLNFPPDCADFPLMNHRRPISFLGRASSLADYGGRAILREVRRMATQGELPDLLVLHLQEAHHPYLTPPTGFAPRTRLRYALGHLAYYLRTSAQVWEFAARADEEAWEAQRAAYRRCIRYAVGLVEEVVRAYETCGALENSLVIVTADHGEHLGEHGLADHQASLHEELVNCPCAVIAPGLAPGSSITGQFQHTDLLHTICRFLDAPAAGYDARIQPLDMLGDSGGHDHAFMQWARWGAEDLAELQRRNPSYDFGPLNRDLLAVRTERWKYIAGSDGSERLFDLRSGALEARNRLDELPEVAARMKAALARWRRAICDEESADVTGRAPDERGVARERLRGLGYI